MWSLNCDAAFCVMPKLATATEFANVKAVASVPTVEPFRWNDESPDLYLHRILKAPLCVPADSILKDSALFALRMY